MPEDSCWTGGTRCENQNSVLCLKEHKGICKLEGSGPFANTECNDKISVHGPCYPRGEPDLSSQFRISRFGTVWFGCDVKWQGTRKWHVASVSHAQSLSRRVTVATHGNPVTTSGWGVSGFRKWSHAMYLYCISKKVSGLIFARWNTTTSGIRKIKNCVRDWASNVSSMTQPSLLAWDWNLRVSGPNSNRCQVYTHSESIRYLMPVTLCGALNHILMALWVRPS